MPSLASLPKMGLLQIGSDLSESIFKERVALQKRVVVLGAAKVGKTAVIEQFLYGTFNDEHIATVEQLYRTEYQLKQGQLTFDILDTSGSFQFPAMKELAIKTGDAFILVFSLDDKESFEEVRQLREMILKLKNDSSIPMVVVGNKSDTSIQKRFLQKEIIETVVCMDWEVGYVECSAKKSFNVPRIFQELVVQAKLPVDVNSLIETAHHKPRRSSLPECPINHFKKDNPELKRRANSCQIS